MKRAVIAYRALMGLAYIIIGVVIVPVFCLLGFTLYRLVTSPEPENNMVGWIFVIFVSITLYYLIIPVVYRFLSRKSSTPSP